MTGQLNRQMAGNKLEDPPNVHSTPYCADTGVVLQGSGLSIEPCPFVLYVDSLRSMFFFSFYPESFFHSAKPE